MGGLKIPQYDFACNCGHRQSVIWPMSRSNELLECSECGGQMYREYNFHTPKDSYSKPIVSDALAISSDQIAEHRKHFPDIELMCDSESARPIFDKFSKHENYLKKTGFKKHRQKIKPKGERIA